MSDLKAWVDDEFVHQDRGLQKEERAWRERELILAHLAFELL